MLTPVTTAPNYLSLWIQESVGLGVPQGFPKVLHFDTGRENEVQRIANSH